MANISTTGQYPLSLNVHEPIRPLEIWLKKLHEDHLYRSVIESRAFKRLKRISFLGAIDYLPYETNLKKAPRSRAEHSLHVAALALFVAEHRNYNKELTNHLVVAALLHDIGHPPLSHSLEPYLKQHFGYGHHEMGQMLLNGEQKTGKQLNKILKTELDIDFIDHLISGNISNDHGGDLFSSPINIDTIDGILRAFGYYTKNTVKPCLIKIAYASFIQDDNRRFEILDSFWKLKDLVYSNVINRPQGIMADQYSQSYFFNGSGANLDEAAIFGDECQWEKSFNSLFSTLQSIKKDSFNVVNSFSDSISFVERKYYVDHAGGFFKRFKSKKTTKQFSLESFVNTSSTRLVQKDLLIS